MNKKEIIDYLKSYAQPPQMMKVFPDFEIIKEAVSMLEQQDSLPKSLETAALRYAIPTYMKDVDENYLHEYPRDPIKEEAFIEGGKWQYQKDRGEFAKIKAKAWSEGFDACKEQMLKEAVEGEIQMRYSGCLCAKTIRAINEDKFKFGDKVRIIIVKEEKK